MPNSTTNSTSSGTLTSIYEEPAVIKRTQRSGALEEVTSNGTVAAAVMVGAALLALVVANSPAYEAVEHFLMQPLTIGFGDILASISVAVIDAVAMNLAREVKAKCITFKEFSDEECEQLGALEGLGYRKGSNLPKNLVLGGFADFDGYCQSLKSRKRSTIKRSSSAVAWQPTINCAGNGQGWLIT